MATRHGEQVDEAENPQAKAMWKLTLAAVREIRGK